MPGNDQQSSTPRRLLLLSRDDCGLCEEFVEALLAAFPADVARIDIANVDSRPGWQGRYGRVIPVLLDDEGSVICETRFDEAAIAQWIASNPAC